MPQPRGAAFFDLDRTLLAGGSGPIIGEALRRVGLLSDRSKGLESVAFRMFDLFGETYPSMLITKQGAKAASGWSVELVQQAADMAAEPLRRAVLPYAHHLFDEHREAGRPLVLATTTPVTLVAPLAKALGFDQVIATKYGEKDGRFDGSIDGEFVWGKGKAKAVAEWAGANGIDLDQSYAYSDSYYDAPLLSMVGHPRAVNPDPRMLALATVRRWPVLHLDVPDGIPKLVGVEPQQVLFQLARPQFLPWVRFRTAGVEKLPRNGAAVLVGNHRSYFDPLAIGYLLAKRGRPVRFLGKREVFDAPVVGDVVKALGGIPVDRGTGSDAPLQRAEQALGAGELVALMPQGTIPRGPAFFDPELKGRWGAAKLAAASGAPVIPIGIWGTEKVWPRSEKFPNILNVLSPPTVSIVVGDPVEGLTGDLDADTALIMSAITALLPAEARQPHEPTPEELARTYPGGKVPSGADEAAEHEADRRPGTD